MGALLAVPAVAGGALISMFSVPLAMLSAACCCFQGLSCVCSTVNLLTCCFRGSLGRKTGVSPRLAKVLYIVLFGLATVAALILRFNSENMDLGVLSVNCSASNGSVVVAGLAQDQYVYCKGDAAVFRISFILTLFFLLMGLLSLVSDAAHRGYWFFKILVLVAGLVGAFFMPDSVFDNSGYAWAARIGSVIFLILQILVLVDFAYQWNEDWVAKAYQGALTEYDEATNKNWLVAILTCALLLYLGTVASFALLYVYYASCPTGVAFITVILLLTAAVTAISLFRDKLVGVEGAVLPAAVVAAYAVFLVWSALQSNPDTTCRPLSSQDAGSIVVGALWATITLCWTSFSVTSNAQHLVQGEELEKPPEVAAEVAPTAAANAPGQPIYRTDAEAGHSVRPSGGGRQPDEEDDEPVPTQEKAWVFHLIMISASMYLAMLLTDWGTESGGSSASEGLASMWVKFVAALATVGLYAWTLVAPAVLKGREFD